MINLENLILGKDDKPIFLALKDNAGQPLLFSDLVDLEVVLAINDVKVATFKKTDNTVIAVAGQTSQCKFLLTAADQATWPTGLLVAQITKITADGDFPEGRNTGQTKELYYCKKAF